MEEANWDRMMVEISCPELLEMVTALINRADILIKMRAPKGMVAQTINRAEKFNKILKRAGYDHYEKDKFTNMRTEAQQWNL